MANNTTTTRNTTTQAAALRWLIDHAVNAPVDVIEAAERLYTAKTKRYERPATVSKERRINEAIMPELVDLIRNNPDELINATWLNDHCNNPEVRSPQKARAIIELAIQAGTVVKYQYKGRTYYRMA